MRGGACLPACLCLLACLLAWPAERPGGRSRIDQPVWAERAGRRARWVPHPTHPSSSHLPRPCAPPWCRSLKEEQGLGNNSAEVAAAVAALLDLKAQLAALQAAAAAAGEAAAAAEQAGSE